MSRLFNTWYLLSSFGVLQMLPSLLGELALVAEGPRFREEDDRLDRGTRSDTH